MQLHELRPKHKLKKRKRIGRGGKRGTYSGRGMKGQKARAGRKMKPAIRQFIKRYPKLRGYKFTGFRLKPAIINIGILEKKFKNNEKISPEILLEKKLIRRIKGKTPKVKILGKGKLAKAFIIEGCDISKAAKAAIKKAGGTVKTKKEHVVQ